jgi:large subunit ribosomal protein L3
MKKNMLGLIGKKVGTTSLFVGTQLKSVTVISVQPNYVTQIKTEKTDGYNALQLTTGSQKAQRVTQSLKGHYKKALMNSAAAEPFGETLKEFRVLNPENYSVGQELTCEILQDITLVDVRGISKGKGFAGVVKRHGFRMQRATHGNSLSHRVHGSTGQNQTPGRVFKGKKMAGRMGCEQVSIQNLKLVSINKEKHYVVVEGAIPGAPGSRVLITPAVKTAEQIQ